MTDDIYLNQDKRVPMYKVQYSTGINDLSHASIHLETGQDVLKFSIFVFINSKPWVNYPQV